MFEKIKLSLPRDILHTIENKRGSLTAEEFIELCLKLWADRSKANDAKPSPELYGTREEFEVFRTGAIHLLLASFSFFSRCSIELGLANRRHNAIDRY